jgi:hypothetical protein
MEQRMAVAAVAEAAAGVERAQALLEATVVLAREAGATWAQIGEATGMSRQSAHERWGCIPRRGCPRSDCGCPDHAVDSCDCGHGPGRGRRRSVVDSPVRLS